MYFDWAHWNVSKHGILDMLQSEDMMQRNNIVSVEYDAVTTVYYIENT